MWRAVLTLRTASAAGEPLKTSRPAAINPDLPMPCRQWTLTLFPRAKSASICWMSLTRRRAIRARFGRRLGKRQNRCCSARSIALPVRVPSPQLLEGSTTTRSHQTRLRANLSLRLPASHRRGDARKWPSCQAMGRRCGRIRWTFTLRLLDYLYSLFLSVKRSHQRHGTAGRQGGGGRRAKSHRGAPSGCRGGPARATPAGSHLLIARIERALWR